MISGRITEKTANIICIVAIAIIMILAATLPGARLFYQEQGIKPKISQYEAAVIAADHIKTENLEQYGVNTALFRDKSMDWYAKADNLTTIDTYDLKRNRITELVYPVNFTLNSTESEPLLTIYVDASTGLVRGGKSN